MFRRARIKLTLWYLVIISVISLFFSTLIYQSTVREIVRVSSMQQLRLDRQMTWPTPPPRIRIDEEMVKEIRSKLLIILYVTNGGIILISGLLGYMLAGKTLKPIKDMVDEQSRFISDSSHELRTPLTAIKTTIEVALRNKDISRQEIRKVLSENLIEVNELQSLSNNLLKLASLENGKVTGDMTKTALGRVVMGAIKKVKPMAESKNITIKNYVRTNEVIGDAALLNELMVILLDNAVKYSKTGDTIKIMSKKTKTGVKLHVVDTGVGIDEKDVSKIFDRFYRTDSARSKQTEAGYGLGLSIAKKIVELHRGKIGVISKLESGSDFWVYLPR